MGVLQARARMPLGSRRSIENAPDGIQWNEGAEKEVEP